MNAYNKSLGKGPILSLTEDIEIEKIFVHSNSTTKQIICTIYFSIRYRNFPRTEGVIRRRHHESEIVRPHGNEHNDKSLHLPVSLFINSPGITWMTKNTRKMNKKHYYLLSKHKLKLNLSEQMEIVGRLYLYLFKSTYRTDKHIYCSVLGSCYSNFYFFRNRADFVIGCKASVCVKKASKQISEKCIRNLINMFCIGYLTYSLRWD